jgi:hypothetical protein
MEYGDVECEECYVFTTVVNSEISGAVTKYTLNVFIFIDLSRV